MMTTILIALIVAGWAAVAIIGTQTYFLGEQTKPIHERNWRSASFEAIAVPITGQPTNYATRTPAYSGDAYSSRRLSSR
ncbi:photosystem II protein, Psb35-related [cf. Phormidesmis sp. LEGE 11477]|uniref:photosystem II protein, Psb35-related n=1 Tax=cf. Phormidesmis sp. LEGE 11477 TaxID=1828680 RepID=UPI001882D2C0|nr:hypothetical protein [cf. Phormidesmis sp. LEGE 11477]